MIRTLRVRGGSQLKRTLGFSGSSTNSANASQSLGVPTPENLLCLIGFARDFLFEWKRIFWCGASSKEEASGILNTKPKLQYCASTILLFFVPDLKESILGIRLGHFR